ncbi:hypothetical protein GCM10010383_36820 [Streptomyces lomondensis]|uniref:Uncharacterized protein n=1 Tax=Streptomyces lomondensis TaxID=68229 RepID=A0ABQ2X7Y9_9ACTN|nr:hypothetical protein GCM10010383_36820 [Streptomyces lomondensis]
MTAVHLRFKVPHRAELVVGAVVALLAATTDVRGAIGFSSFGVLAYYAVANACAWTLRPHGPSRAYHPRGRACRLPAPGLRSAAVLGALRGCGAGRRCLRLRGPARAVAARTP